MIILQKDLHRSIILYRNECILTGYFYSTIKDILPYGSQLLLAGSIASVPPISLLTQGVYRFILAVVTIGKIIINSRKERRYTVAA
nr:hypothetical protein [Wolbachia endosymbiont of Brugia pahangi]